MLNLPSIQLYILVFCRVVIGLVFTWSSTGKVRDVPAFIQATARFQILPAWLVRPAALVFLGSELALVIAMLYGGPLLWGGFLLAAGMLAVFFVALCSVLLRKIRTSCNCFGTSVRPVSPYDLVRNAGFILCAACGLVISIGLADRPANLDWPGWVLMSAVALAFVAIWVNLSEIAQLFSVDPSFSSHPLYKPEE